MKHDWRIYFAGGILALLIGGYVGDEVFDPLKMNFSFRTFSFYIIAAAYFLTAVGVGSKRGN